MARGRGRGRVDWNVGTPGSIQEITYTVPADKCGLVIGKGRSGCGGLSTPVSQREPRSCSPVPILAPSTSVTWVSFALPVSLALVRGCPATAREAGLCPLGMCGACVEDVGESPGLSGPCNSFVPVESAAGHSHQSWPLGAFRSHGLWRKQLSALYHRYLRCLRDTQIAGNMIWGYLPETGSSHSLTSGVPLPAGEPRARCLHAC